MLPTAEQQQTDPLHAPEWIILASRSLMPPKVSLTQLMMMMMMVVVIIIIIILNAYSIHSTKITGKN